MVFAMALTLVGCGDSGKKASIDLSGYPDKFEEWTTADVMKYFEDKGLFTDKDGQVIQTATYPDYNPAPPEATELGSYMPSDNELVCIMILYFDPNTTDEKVKAGFDKAKADKNLNLYGEMTMNMTHMIGQFAFIIECGDPEFESKFEEAIEDLCKDMSVTKDY